MSTRQPLIVVGAGIAGLSFDEDDIKAIRSAYKKLFLKKDGNLATSISSLKATHSGDSPHVAHLIDFVEKSQRGVTR